MSKNLFIAEKPSVAREFARVMGQKMQNHEGYLESDEAIVTWCIGHLITMSYPDAYDARYKRWSLDTIPFVPTTFKYEVIANAAAKKQYKTVSALLKRPDVDTIYVCTDAGREGEYIYRLVEKQCGLAGKVRRRVWIDSQTEDEIKRGIREAKDLAEYDNLAAAAYLRAKEDYLMGINFSRALTLKYAGSIKSYLKADRASISVGRVMTCVLGLVVRREREIREFVKTPFFRVLAVTALGGQEVRAEWKAVEGSRYHASPLLYKENGFRTEADAQELVKYLSEPALAPLTISEIERKKENKHAPLLYNLAELQNDCAKFFKISPDETLAIAQELYDKKLATYPRTDARVLSSAVGKEIERNIKGLTGFATLQPFAEEVLTGKSWQKINNTRYVNDKLITDHYAIIPTGQGLSALGNLSSLAAAVYELIARRFLAIFYPAAVYQKVSLVFDNKGEKFYASFKALAEAGYLAVARKADAATVSGEETEQDEADLDFIKALAGLKKGAEAPLKALEIKEGETAPPKRYNSGTLILAMENAGQLIEDEELRAQIKGSGIGTSATRAEILKKLVHIKYLGLNKKTQIVTPTLLGEMVYDVVAHSLKALLDPALTASWEKGLSLVTEGEVTEAEYMAKLKDFVERRTNQVKEAENMAAMKQYYDAAAVYYRR
jgi:DNA topoisomerase-3